MNTQHNLSKGQAVWLVQSWDGRGKISIMRCTVDSAGKQQIHLRQSNGEMTKHRIYTRMLAGEPCGLTGVRIVPVEGTDIQAFALDFARAVIDYEREHLTRCLENTEAGEGYRNAIRAELAKLHDPEVIDRTTEV